MHSSRMRTDRLFTVSLSIPRGGGVCPGGCLLNGVSTTNYCPLHAGICALPPLWTEGMAHASENITSNFICGKY